MTLREATEQALLILNTVTITGQGNITKIASVFNLLEAVRDKLTDLEKEGVENGGGV